MNLGSTDRIEDGASNGNLRVKCDLCQYNIQPLTAANCSRR